MSRCQEKPNTCNNEIELHRCGLPWHTIGNGSGWPYLNSIKYIMHVFMLHFILTWFITWKPVRYTDAHFFIRLSCQWHHHPDSFCSSSLSFKVCQSVSTSAYLIWLWRYLRHSALEPWCAVCALLCIELLSCWMVWLVTSRIVNYFVHETLILILINY